jgi:hypothetical protein
MRMVGRFDYRHNMQLLEEVSGPVPAVGRLKLVFPRIAKHNGKTPASSFL